MTIPADADPPEVARHLEQATGQLAFDIGGNTGLVAAGLAARFARVISFEPADESYKELARAAEMLPNLHAIQLAVSDHDGEIELAVQVAPIRAGQLTSPEHAQLAAAMWGPIISKRTIPCRTLDSLATDYGVPDFVKIDVEGHDAHVVRGGLVTLTEHSPALYIEVHAAGLGDQIQQLLTGVYGDRLRVIRNPHYPPNHWGHSNHYWLIASDG